MGPINSVYEEFESNQNNLMVLAICSDGADATVKSKHDAAGIDFPIISGSSGGSGIFNSFKISATPTLILIKPDKSIPEKDIWPISTLEGTMAKYDILDGSSVSGHLDTKSTVSYALENEQLSFNGLTNGEYTVSMYSLQGRTLLQKSIDSNVKSISLADISTGVYTVTIDNVDTKQSFILEVK